MSEHPPAADVKRRETVDDALRSTDRDHLSGSSAQVILADEVRALRQQLLDLRQAAVAFAFIAVMSDRNLRLAHTLEGLRLECNRCRPADVMEIKPGWRT